MSLQENKEIVQRVVDMVNEGKLAQLKECYTSDFVNHDPSAPAVRNREALMQTFAVWGTGFPDARVTIEEMIAEGDKVVKRWTYHGTHDGEFMGIPATGKEIAMAAITIYRISGGVVGRSYTDEHRALFGRVVHSFRPLEPREREQIWETRLRIRHARAGEGLERLGRRTRNAWDVEQTAIANALSRDAVLTERQLVKIGERRRYPGSAR